MSTISAGTTSTTTLIHSGDTTGSLVLKTNDTGSGGTTAVTIDTSQNVGIGTSSPSYKLDVQNGTARIYNSTYPSLRIHNSTTGTASNDGLLLEMAGADANFVNYEVGNMIFKTTDTERMRIDSSGNVGIGTSSPTGYGTVNLNLNSSGDTMLHMTNTTSGTTSGDGFDILLTGLNAQLINREAGYVSVYTSNAERMRINSNGTVGIGVAGQSAVSGVNGVLSVKNTANDGSWGLAIETTGATTNRGIGIVYGNAPNSTGQEFAYWLDSTTLRFSVRSNGGIANYSANNANLSDERTKTDIQNAGSYLAKICAIPVRTFKYKDQTDDFLNLGVIAQEVEIVAPELVDASGFGETPEDGVPLKAIYQTDLQYALMKCIQEQQALIQQLQADVAALKGV